MQLGRCADVGSKLSLDATCGVVNVLHCLVSLVSVDNGRQFGGPGQCFEFVSNSISLVGFDQHFASEAVVAISALRLKRIGDVGRMSECGRTRTFCRTTRGEFSYSSASVGESSRPK